MSMATKIAPQLKVVPRATADVVAKFAEGIAPHGLPYDPPPREEVLELIREATIEGVARELRDPEDNSWLLRGVRDLLMVSYRGVWEVAKKGRGLRSRAEQNEIFKLNHRVNAVRSRLAGKTVNLSPDGWDLNAWKSQEREKSEWEEAKASLPAKLRDTYDQVQWVLTEKKMRAKFAKDDRQWVRNRKKRMADGLSSKDLKALDAWHAAEAVKREKELERLKRWHTATVEERIRMQKAEDAARKKK